jgi:hypothetical protein
LNGIAIDKNDNIYVSEITDGLYGYIRRVDTKQVAHVAAGSPHEDVVNGRGHTVRFRNPADIAFDKHRYTLYSVSGSSGTIRKIDKDRNVSTYKKIRATVIGIDTKGQIHHSTQGKIYKILPNGQTVTILGSTEGYKDGPASQALLRQATAYIFYPDGSFLFADLNGYIRKVDKHRNVSTITPFRKGQGGINYIYGMVQDSKGNIYLSENQYAVISKISANTNKLETYAGSTEERGNTDGSLKNARFHFPTGIAIDKYDNLYVGDSWSGLIRKIDTKTGMVSTIAGEVDSHTASRNGVGSDAHFGSIYGVAYDPRRHALFVAEKAFSKIQIILLK